MAAMNIKCDKCRVIIGTVNSIAEFSTKSAQFKRAHARFCLGRPATILTKSAIAPSRTIAKPVAKPAAPNRVVTSSEKQVLIDCDGTFYGPAIETQARIWLKNDHTTVWHTSGEFRCTNGLPFEEHEFDSPKPLISI